MVPYDETDDPSVSEKERHYYRYLLGVAALAIFSGTIFYHLVEKLSWVDAYYFSVVTLSTVGYGDITPHTAAEKLFTTFYIFVGVGILATFLSVSMNQRMRRRTNRKLKRQQSRADKQKQTDK
jgi:voltage-gated potassium channel